MTWLTNLFGMEEALASPIARRSDPEPSNLAAGEITASGARENQLHAVLELVRQFPRKTSLELSRYSELDRFCIARRLPELEHGGLVSKCGVRTCEVGKRRATIWEAV